ncbi:MAG: mechanosensitive ion channel family protein [Betaproteobacteria bacterium]|nr:mechanosensitive ion channel family protein [Betaproteobacteria bacterium]
MEATLRDASLYAGIAVLLGVLSFLAPPVRRRGLLLMAVVALVALAGVWLLANYGGRFGDRTLYEVVREALLALLALAVIRSVLLFATRIALARFNVPSIVSDVLQGLALIVYALFRLDAVGVNLAGIVTTSAIVTGAIAFSAQEVLGALWAGIALQADRTLRIGDWILFDGKSGQVVGIRWRTTSIRTKNYETIIIPNASLIKDKIHVLYRAGTPELALREIPFSVAYDQVPSRVVAVVDEAVQRADLPNVGRDPPPWSVCASFDDSGITYKLLYRIVDLGRSRDTDSTMLGIVYAALQRAGMVIPFPQRDVHVFRAAGPEERLRREVERRLVALAQVELFALLTETERRTLAAAVQPGLFVRGEALFRQGEPADSLFVLARGRLGVYDERDGAARRRLAELDAPGYVGEMGLLTGQPRGATVVAESDVECLRVDKAAFDAVLRARPEIVDELSQVLARRQAENDATLQALGVQERGAREHGRARELMLRIRKFFSLSPSAGPR